MKEKKRLLPKLKEYYRIEEVAKDWGCDVEDILYHSKQGNLTIGVIPFPQAIQHCFRETKIDIACLHDLNDVVKGFQPSHDLMFITDEERKRFEAQWCDEITHERKDRELKKRVKIIGLLLEICADGRTAFKLDGGTGDFNAFAIEKQLKEKAKKLGIDTYGLSDDSIRSIIEEYIEEYISGE